MYVSGGKDARNGSKASGKAAISTVVAFMEVRKIIRKIRKLGKWSQL